MTYEHDMLPEGITSDEMETALSGLSLDRRDVYSSYEHGEAEDITRLIPRADEYFRRNPDFFGTMAGITDPELEMMYSEVTDETRSAYFVGIAITIELLSRIGEIRGISPDDFSKK